MTRRRARCGAGPRWRGRLDDPTLWARRGEPSGRGVARRAASEAAPATYGGPASGRPLPEPYRASMRWTAQQVPEYESVFASWPKPLRLEIDGLGDVLFCHGTPRSETEIFTRSTAE